jgi:ssDNA-binding Zn-finger/Zn-ribbon topoisomerase 1
MKEKLTEKETAAEVAIRPVEGFKCPNCLGPMVARTNRQNGDKFWGCKKYPECKGTRDSMGLSREERDAQRDKENQTVRKEDRHFEISHQEGFPFNRR